MTSNNYVTTPILFPKAFYTGLSKDLTRLCLSLPALA
jgi:hypothetical protein